MGKCKDCNNFHPYSINKDYGECKYRPPQISNGLIGREYPICSAEVDGCSTGFVSKEANDAI